MQKLFAVFMEEYAKDPLQPFEKFELICGGIALIVALAYWK